MKTRIRWGVLCAALSLVAGPARAQGAAFLDWGHGYGVNAWGAGLRAGGVADIWRRGAWRLDRDWAFRLARFTSDHGDGRSLWDAAAYPVFRLTREGAGWLQPYVEGGLGAHLISRTRIGDRNLGVAFQFGEFLALGVRFGERRAYALALRAEHVSNAHIKLPNDGVSFYGIEFQYSLPGSP